MTNTAVRHELEVPSEQGDKGNKFDARPWPWCIHLL